MKSTSRLSGREREVARVASSGVPTRKIAEELFISTRTVESHLGSIYRKLGVTTRAGLVAALNASNQVDDDGVTRTWDIPGLVTAPHFVGRQDELHRIAEAASVARTGQSRFVFIGGESGAGKSSLLASSIEMIEADTPGTIFLARCIEDLGTPFGPLAESLQSFLRSQPDPLDDVGGPDCGVLATLMPSLAHRLPELNADLDPTVRPRLVVESFRQVIAYAGRQRLIVLVIEDLHWVDAASIAFLRTIISDTSTLPLLLIATFRDTESDSNHALSGLLADLWKLASVERIDLGGLSRDDAMSLASALSDEPPDAGVVTRLHHATAGNPLYLDVLLRETSGRGASPLPASLQAAVADRISRLHAMDPTPLEIAAVAGLDFDLSVVEAALGHPHSTPTSVETDHRLPSSALDLAERARRAGLLAESSAPGADYRFVHDVVRQAMLERIGAPRRRRLHAAVGHALIATSGTDARAWPVIAQHLAHSPLPGDRLLAGDHVLRSIRSGVTLLSPDDAALLADMALENLPGGDAGDVFRLALLIELIDVHNLRVDHTAHRGAVIEAVAVARRSGTPRDVAVALTHYRLIPLTGSADTEILALVDDAVAGLTGDSIDEQRLRALLRGYSAYHRGIAGEGFGLAVEAERAVAEARSSGDLPTIAITLYNLGGVLLGSPEVERMAEALHEHDQIRHLVPEHVDRHDGIRLAACAALQSGDRAGFDHLRERLARSAEESRSGFLLAMTTMWSALTALIDGRLDDATHANDALFPQAMSDPNVLLGWLAQLLIIRTEQQRAAEIIPLAEQTLDEHGDIPAVRALVAWVLDQSGDTDHAWEIVAPLAASDFSSVGNDWLLAATLAWLTPAVIGRGTTDHARTLLERLLPYGGQVVIAGSATLVLGAADRPIGLLLARTGKAAEGLERLATASSLEARIGAPLKVATTRLETARVLLGLGGTEQICKAESILDQCRDAAISGAWPHLRALEVAVRAGH